MKDKVYIIMPYYLPGQNGGGPVSSIKNILSYLDKKFDFYIITKNVDLNDPNPYPVKTNTWIKNSNHHIYYFEKKDYHARNILKIIDDTENNVLFLNSFFTRTTIQFMILRRLKRLKNMRIILAPRGEFSKGALGQKSFKKAIFIKMSKIVRLYQNVLWKASSTLEQEDIRKIYPTAVCKIAADLVDRENYFHVKKKKEKKHLKMIFLSRISPMKNLALILKILNEYQKQIQGKIEFDIYGPLEDKRYFDQCKMHIDSLNQGDSVRVNYFGKISNHEVKRLISQYHLFILPTKGENFGHVIVESLMANTPIIISDRTKWNNLESYHIGYNIKLNETREYYEKIVEFLNADQEEFNRYLLKIPLYIEKELHINLHVQQHIDLFNS